jgi:hypothetical protein
VCQLRAGFVKDEGEREALWEQQHEIGAQKMYSLCSELGGLFLKVPYFAPFFSCPCGIRFSSQFFCVIERSYNPGFPFMLLLCGTGFFCL